MILVHVVLAGLAGARVALLLTEESGPGSIFSRIRAASQRFDPATGRSRPVPFVAGVLSCYWCCSCWTTAGAWLLGWGLSWTPVAVAAAAGVALVAYRATKGGSG